MFKAGKLADLDLEHLGEELEALGRRDRRDLKRQVTQVIVQLLKWHSQPERCSGSWRGSIVEGQVRSTIAL